MHRASALVDFINHQRLLRAREPLIAEGATKFIYYVWRPQFHSLLKGSHLDMLVYHIDDDYTFGQPNVRVEALEDDLIRAAELVIIHSPSLFRKKGGINPNTKNIPNGVDFEKYRTEQREPSDLALVPRPRVGYVGIIKKQLDYRLIWQVARHLPAISFVFVGPEGNLGDKEDDLRELASLPNVYFLGGKPPAELAAYTQHLDACMLCYEVTEYTNDIYPLKLHEYLACGKPVVSSPINTAKEFSGVIDIATTTDEWIAAVRRALSEPATSAPRVQQRVELAKMHDWHSLVRRIAEAIREALGDEQRQSH